MKTRFLTFLAILFNSATAFAQIPGYLAPNGAIAVVVSKDEVKVAPGDPQAHICISNDWFDLDMRIHQLVRVEKETIPFAFNAELSKSNNAYCFDTQKIPHGREGTFEEILARIEMLSNDQVMVPVSKETIAEIQSAPEPEQTQGEKLAQGLIPAQVPSPNPSPTFYHLRNEDKSLGRKLLRAEAIVGGVEVVGMASLMLLPPSITNWPDKPWLKAGANLKKAWTQPPHFDKDHWAINYIGHPYSGALYYNSLRSQRATILQSFLFSVVESTIWEYLVEAISERPSIQDLFITPVVGSALGELTHRATMRMRRGGFKPLEKAAVLILNPTYVINNGFKEKKRAK
ncbi:MAG: DUF3943 domain-containing protein [Bdellovibrionales bacterium]|nr:DUF3943 domain-containing protein [Bdellovibrionales bacterium]